MVKLVIAALATILLTSFISSAVPAVAAKSETAAEYYYELSGGRTAALYLAKNQHSNDWVVFMPGNNDKAYKSKQSAWLKTVTQARPLNLLTINKAGVRFTGKCNEDEYQFSSVREQRIADTLTVMKAVIPADARILLIANSEGGYLVADVALADPRVKAVIDISGSTQSWITEEIMYLEPGPKREKARAFFENEVIGNLDYKKFYSGWNYVWLNSMHTRKAYESMKALNVPVLWMNGDRDDILWIEGAHEEALSLIEKEGKSNIEYHWLKDADHGLHCPKKLAGCDDVALQKKVHGLIQTFTTEKF